MGYTPPWFNLTKVAGGWTFTPPSASTDDFQTLANSIDTESYIKLNGAAGIQCGINSGSPFEILYEGPISLLKVIYTANGPDISPSAVNKDLIFAPTGTGRLRYGTHNATGDTACNGYIEIKDAGGTTRKLMVTA